MPTTTYRVDVVPTQRGGPLAYLFNGGYDPQVYGFIVNEVDVVDGRHVNPRPRCVSASYATEEAAREAGDKAKARLEREAASIRDDLHHAFGKVAMADAAAVRLEMQYGGFLR